MSRSRSACRSLIPPLIDCPDKVSSPSKGLSRIASLYSDLPPHKVDQLLLPQLITVVELTGTITHWRTLFQLLSTEAASRRSNNLNLCPEKSLSRYYHSREWTLLLNRYAQEINRAFLAPALISHNQHKKMCLAGSTDLRMDYGLTDPKGHVNTDTMT